MGVDVQFIVTGFGDRDERDRFIRRIGPVAEPVELKVPDLDSPVGYHRAPRLDEVMFAHSMARYLTADPDGGRSSSYWPMIRQQALALLSIPGGYTVLYASDDIDSGSTAELLVEAARGLICVVDDRWVAVMDEAHGYSPVKEASR